METTENQLILDFLRNSITPIQLKRHNRHKLIGMRRIDTIRKDNIDAF